MLERLRQNNRDWAARMLAADPGFFSRLERGQAPGYLWIGCSDSRVPATQIVGLDPGELFEHRNVANLVTPGDPSAQAVIQYAVAVLRVRHILVVGHHGCGGVAAAMDGGARGRMDAWLDPIRTVHTRHRTALDAIPDPAARLNRLVELNVRAQVANVAADAFVQDAWARGQALAIHGWVYDLATGLLSDLRTTVDGSER